MSSAVLSPVQLDALLDILVHHETYAEAESFKDPEAIEHYGYPFEACCRNGEASGGQKSASPLLQLLLTRLVLTMPGIRDLSPEFWADKFRNIMRKFGEAELSESYDKGTLGSRKRLVSAASAIHECVTRGLLSGVRLPDDYQLPDLRGKYNLQVASDLARAWDDVVQHLVYGNLIDELFDQFMETSNLEGHSPAVEAAVNHAVIYVATFLHHLFVLSAEGPYLLKLLDSVHTLIPYSAIGQTLRIGNAGTMVNAMVRLFLAKISVGALSNWLGLTQNAADGMNLMQKIISLVLEWDTGDFRKAVDSIERSSERPSKKHLAAINEHLQSSREQHNFIRALSKKGQMSIIIAILESKDPALAESLTAAQHTQCLEYYSAQLAIRDREQITEVLCRQNPDLITSIVRDLVAVFEPMIRTIHKNVDIRKHLVSVQNFLSELIDTSKPKKRELGQGQSGIVPPSVEDYVDLLNRNRQLAYDYLHDFAEGCPELRTTWLEWARNSLRTFEQTPGANSTTCAEGKDANGLDGIKVAAQLQKLFNQVPKDKQSRVKAAIDAHAGYLSALEAMSRTRTQKILDKTGALENSKAGGNMGGPGVYIIRWHHLLDVTTVTPNTPRGPPRKGRDVKGHKALGKTGAVARSDTWNEGVARQDEQGGPEPPDVSIVVDTLGSVFKKHVADLAAKSISGKSQANR
ncbi:PX-associated-domain-containing protein [Durotheca rogersii]|uniref:PX-associated-domain-containing protein n=1 Tax=Durotheca rogersii TaxID=419775 RepID=UPI0022208A9A|nr:PX-associated-domain-containing protein [Durotheca rogersii]KAI5855091.1 PX-associated-domain-containing protein [Durotheca rogersii]